MEGRPKIALVTLLAFSFLLVSPAEAIDCVQCTSDGSPDCISTPPAAKSCTPTSNYCITVTETFYENDTLSLLTRTCSPVNLGLKCQENQSPSGGTLKVCHEVCDKDGCNNKAYVDKSGADHISSGVILISSVPLLLIHRWLT